MAIRNFMPYPVHIRLKNGQEVVFPSEGHAKCSSFVEHLSPVNDIPRKRVGYGHTEGLPPVSIDFLIVDYPVFQCLKGVRHDVLTPDLDMSRDIVLIDEPKKIFAKGFLSH